MVSETLGECACLHRFHKSVITNLLMDKIGEYKNLAKKIQETSEQERIIEYGTQWIQHIRVTNMAVANLEESLEAVEKTPTCNVH